MPTETGDMFWMNELRKANRTIDEKNKEIELLVKNNNDLKDRCEKLELQLAEQKFNPLTSQQVL